MRRAITIRLSGVLRSATDQKLNAIHNAHARAVEKRFVGQTTFSP